MENMSLSDIAAVTRGNDDGDGWGGNGAWLNFKSANATSVRVANVIVVKVA